LVNARKELNGVRVNTVFARDLCAKDVPKELRQHSASHDERVAEEAGGSPAAGHLSCAAKKGNPKKAAPEVAPSYQRVTLRCLSR